LQPHRLLAALAAAHRATMEEREVGQMAVWSLSTAKPGNGVEQLRDDNTDTYWQSDGPQPHLINIQFHKKSKRPARGTDLRRSLLTT